jgi:putative endonuclease
VCGYAAAHDAASLIGPGLIGLRLLDVTEVDRGAVGAAAEEAAAAHVLAAGMRILERNLRVHRLELDIVALDGDAVVVIEVRLRGPGAWTRALSSIDRKKRDRLRRAAQLLWTRRFSKMPGVARMRFDVAAVGEDGSIEYVRAAFI